MDGSPQDWLQGRGPKMMLKAFIDDASGNVAGRFHEYEATLPAFDVFQRYCEQYGLPCSVYNAYLNRHTTCKVSLVLDLYD